MEQIYLILIGLSVVTIWITVVFMLLYMVKRKKGSYELLMKYHKVISISGKSFLFLYTLTLIVRFRTDFSLDNLPKTFLAILSLFVLIAVLAWFFCSFQNTAKKELEKKLREKQNLFQESTAPANDDTIR